MVGIRGARQVALTIGACIVGKGNRLVGGATQAVGDRSNSIQGVVTIRSDGSSSVGRRGQIPTGVVRIARSSGVRADLSRQIAEAVVGVRGNEIPWIGHRDEVVVR